MYYTQRLKTVLLEVRVFGFGFLQIIAYKKDQAYNLKLVFLF